RGGHNFTSRSGKPVVIEPPMVVLEFEHLGDKKYPKPVTLCHYPVARWDRSHHGAWHLHGHSHGFYKGRGFILDVGVDCHDFYPISLGAVAGIMEARGDE
ncbi:MAG: hypothetical protein Q8P59_07165, partial [Dehalococcoidia bacterium]|nr:hypothetical protein [Dehalococcoidia bacterium]